MTTDSVEALNDLSFGVVPEICGALLTTLDRLYEIERPGKHQKPRLVWSKESARRPPTEGELLKARLRRHGHELLAYGGPSAVRVALNFVFAARPNTAVWVAMTMAFEWRDLRLPFGSDR
jgi:hypothetical protein